MSKLITNTIRHTGATVDALTFDSSGNTLLTDNLELQFGSSADLRIDWDGSRSLINSYTAGTLKIMSNGNQEFQTNGAEMMIKAIKDGAVELYHNNDKKLETTSGGVTVTGYLNMADDSTSTGGDIYIPDVGILNIGNGNDLKIYHDGFISKIVDTSGNLHIGTNSFELKRQGLDETMLKASANGAVELYYDNSKKFETTTNGIAVTGRIEPTDHIFMDAGYGIAFDPYGAGGANLLNDYEEGTCQISMQCVGTSSSGSINLDSSDDTLFYVKIGRVVHLQGRLKVASVSSPAGTATQFSGLPFTNTTQGSGENGRYGIIPVYTHNINVDDSTYAMGIHTDDNSSTGNIYQTRDNGGWIETPPTEWVANSYLIVQGYYFTDQ